MVQQSGANDRFSLMRRVVGAIMKVSLASRAAIGRPVISIAACGGKLTFGLSPSGESDP
jgi:hypothetical protein